MAKYINSINNKPDKTSLSIGATLETITAIR